MDKKTTIKKRICICGHPKSEHTNLECWNKIVVKGSTYRCVCRCFTEEELK